MRNGGYPTVSVRKTRRGHRNKLNLIKEVVMKKIILTNKKITNENQYIAFELWFHRFVSWNRPGQKCKNDRGPLTFCCATFCGNHSTPTISMRPLHLPSRSFGPQYLDGLENSLQPAQEILHTVSDGAKQPQSITDPLPCLTEGTVFFSRHASFFEHRAAVLCQKKLFILICPSHILSGDLWLVHKEFGRFQSHDSMIYFQQRCPHWSYHLEVNFGSNDDDCCNLMM